MGNPTQAQVDTTLALLQILDDLYGIDDVGGHHEYPDNDTDCPGINAEDKIDWLDEQFE